MRLKSPISVRKGCKITWAISMTTKINYDLWLHQYVYKKKEPKFELKFHVPAN